MRKNIIWLLTVSCLLTGCTKEGDTIYLPTPDEEQPSTAPLVTVIYGPDGLGDRSYFDLIYKGVEAAGKQYGVRTLQLSPRWLGTVPWYHRHKLSVGAHVCSGLHHRGYDHRVGWKCG